MADSSFLDRVSRRWLGFRFSDTRCLVAVSGGADSVSLLLALLEIHPDRERIEVAHFNHRWRGDESDGDASFVVALCEQLHVRCHVGVAEHRGDAVKSESVARDARYEYLAKTAYAVGARTVATAHTSDDCVETMVHNLFRGSGMAGVASIPHVRALDDELLLVRPMIDVKRTEVENFLLQRRQGYRQDASNQDTAYRRNYLRNELLPEIRSIYGEGVDRRLLRFAEHAASYMALLTRLESDYEESVQNQLSDSGLNFGYGNRIVFLRKQAFPTDWLIVREYLVRRWKEMGWSLAAMNAAHWDRIREVYEAGKGEEARIDKVQSSSIRMNLPGDLQVVQQDPWLEISEKTV
ncbi:MAG: tRNA lysidine(34) synthetase TilS [Aureliella sp.]